jgi:hypothetical protein
VSALGVKVKNSKGHGKSGEALKVKRACVLLCLVLLFPVPVQAVVYEPASYLNDGVVVNVSLQAATPWTAPFVEAVEMNVSVVPAAMNLIHVNITRVSIIVNRADPDELEYSLIAAEEKSGSPLSSGVAYANYTGSFEINGQLNGLECYFAIIVSGSYFNTTGAYYFQAMSPENLVGPFTIGSSLATPTNLVGLAVIGISSLICVAGVFGVKRSRTRVRRKSLLDE